VSRTEALARLQIAAKQAILSIAVRDHREEEAARIFEVGFAMLSVVSAGAATSEQIAAAIAAGVLAAEKELAEPKPKRSDRAEKGHARAVAAAGRMIASNYRPKGEQMALEEGAG
jgi:hypothetical protein